ncbi:MAG: LuxR C-terminal-related transcriptional regulator, partial [Pseudonocardia sp.]|nr:LuxR C-terminal-related transcriptional regulator [Pseudonocardia sp.]
RHAWHRAWAGPGPDEGIAAALAEAAVAAAARGGLTESATLMERAAGLSPVGEAGAFRFAAAARQRLVTGSPDLVTALCDRALVATTDARLRSRVVRLRAQARQISGDPRAGIGELLAEADRIGPVRLAAPLLTEASSAQLVIGDLDAAVETAKRAYALTRDADDAGARTAEIVLGVALLWSGLDPAAAGLFEPLVGRPIATPPAVESYWSALLGFGLMQLGHFDVARSHLRGVVEAVRRRSAVALLPLPLGVLAYVEHRMGETLTAQASATEAVQLARDLGGLSHQPATLATFVWTAGALGDIGAARSTGRECIELAPRTGSFISLISANAALGFAELGAGQPERAIGPLEEAERLSLRLGFVHYMVTWPADLIETYLACGRRADALAVLGRLESSVPDRAGWTLAAVARSHGMLTSGPASDEHFAAAIRLHDATPTPLDRARTLLCWGESLRRSGRRIEARDKLREALQVFERINTPQWADRARRELAGTGERSRRRSPDTRAELTPQEMQIALAVADGATNREAAAALFLSPKTVENHLGRIYAKLRVRSRTELAAR